MKTLLHSIACLLLASLTLAAAPRTGDETGDGVSKLAPRLKTRLHTPAPLADIEDNIAPQWRVLQKSPRTARAFVIGDYRQLEAGDLKTEDFVPLYPPDILAALGLATVYQPDTAGWFLVAGRRLHVRTTDPERRYATLSYESMARAAWAVGLSSQTLPSARIYYDSGMHVPMALGNLLERAVRTAPDTGAWIVAGQARFARLRGRALRRPPIEGRRLERPEEQDEEDRTVFSPVAERAQSALFAALLVDTRRTSGPIPQLSTRFFGADEADIRFKHYLVRVHYAALKDPAPPIDPGLPFQSIWDDPPRGRELPQVRVVRQGLLNSTTRRAHVSVFAIGQTGPFDLYPEPEFVDLKDLAPDILVDQKWAYDDTFVGEPIYEKPRLVLRRPVAEALVRINERLRARGLQLLIYDGYRPLSVTQRLWALRPDRRYLAVPNVGSRHNRGAAVDLTLADSMGNPLEMPSEYLTFDERSHRNRQDISLRARQNMDLLTRAMAEEGFTGINEEWWHYDAPGWRNYRVADVPLWPPQSAPTTPTLQTADRTPSAPLNRAPDLTPPDIALAIPPASTPPHLPDRPSPTPTPGPQPSPTPFAPPLTGLDPPPLWQRYRPTATFALGFLSGLLATVAALFIVRKMS